MTRKKDPAILLENYLEKHNPPYRIDKPADAKTGLIVVIPAYREDELIFTTLKSLFSCEPPSFRVEVIVVLNAPEDELPAVVGEQKACAARIRDLARTDACPRWLDLFALEAYDLRKKHFGAGLARKTGLDEAARRFHNIETPDGVLACLDADSPVAGNYFTAIEEWFSNSHHAGASIYFEHPLEGENFPDEVYEAITLYELHLRYYLLALKQTRFPYAYHTVGSCMAFRAINYARVGGMPKKQAGEDFYLLQKLIPLGGFDELNTTTVYPSPRPSDRVIFGTGASVKNHLQGTQKQGTTYNPQAFNDLKTFFLLAPELEALPPEEFEDWTYQLTGPLRSYLLNSNFEKELRIIQQNSSNKKTFLKRFFGTFNAFTIIRYLNYAHEHFYAKSDLFEAAIATIETTDTDLSDILDEKELLTAYRRMEKGDGG
ncbi:glycosyltransferase [Marinilabilia salmonicolor]|uniref:glycosyltransferase n=1 Tax=Marinilabilia salmonicolor TaxID=989 RepID=UPI00029AEE81|nr:glycosyltransferase family 2 protein [Marinilabilia salmonicolor]